MPASHPTLAVFSVIIDIQVTAYVVRRCMPVLLLHAMQQKSFCIDDAMIDRVCDE